MVCRGGGRGNGDMQQVSECVYFCVCARWGRRGSVKADGVYIMFYGYEGMHKSQFH